MSSNAHRLLTMSSSPKRCLLFENLLATGGYQTCVSTVKGLDLYSFEKREDPTIFSLFRHREARNLRRAVIFFFSVIRSTRPGRLFPDCQVIFWAASVRDCAKRLLALRTHPHRFRAQDGAFQRRHPCANLRQYPHAVEVRVMLTSKNQRHWHISALAIDDACARGLMLKRTRYVTR
jgi:hypothetical protein